MRKKLSLGICLIALCTLSSCTYYCGKNKLVKHFTAIPATIPAVYDYKASVFTKPDYDINDPIITHFSDMPIPQKSMVPKTDVTRILIAKLVQGKEVKEVNDFLMTLTPWSGHGTQWAFHPHGDYDFTEITMCTLLYLFADKPDVLFPQTRDHVINTLIEYHGSKQALRTPGFMGIMRETENHILMGEISRYLKNQWLHEHGDTSRDNDNQRNGMEKWMLNHLDEKFRGGFYEFNSDPYSGYSFQALITLFSFTHSDTVRYAGNKLLNELIYEYSLSSINESRYTIFRRQIHRAGDLPFDGDPISSVVRVLVTLKTGETLKVRAKGHGLLALLLHYRLNDTLAQLLTETHKNYFAKLGHGRMGAPEIYYGGDGFIISAGGMQRGIASQLAPRPEMLLLNNHVGNRDSCFYLCAKGGMHRWNNTGVYYNFACANQAPHIPPQFKPALEKAGWQLFHDPQKAHTIITYSAKNVGLLMATAQTNDSDENILNNIINSNAGINLRKQFRHPSKGLISYELHSPPYKWVITKVNDQKTDRLIDKWQRLNVTYGPVQK